MKNIPIRHINATQQEPGFSESFAIRNVSDLLAGKDMVQELHRHDFFFLLALKKATGNHEIDFTTYTVGSNAVFFMRPGQVHQLTLKAGSTGYLAQFKADFYYPQDQVSNQLLNKASNKNHYQFDANKFKKLLSVLTDIFQEYTGKHDGYQEVIKANLAILFIELVRQHSSDPVNIVNTYTQERLEAFLALLETHIATHKQASEYAKLLNLSLYQLNTITKTTLGKTCSALINEHIILESRRQLLATTSQVKEIADHLGYEDVSYFIRFFKKHTGYSPEVFRHNFK
ncbi:MAG: AraC family transcriptional regulator [Ferruginibacter sp.]